MKVARSQSISTKLLRMNLLVSGTVLLIAVMAFFAFDLFSFRLHLVQTLETEAQMAGKNSVSALLFDDRQSAQTTLETLCSSPDISAAALVTLSGTVFAQFHCPGHAQPLTILAMPSTEREHQWWHGQNVVLADRIIFAGKPVGTVYIAAHLVEIRQRAMQYLLIAGAILIFCMLAALIISANTRRLMAAPIIALAEVARSVSRDKDYSVRTQPSRENDEIAVLIRAFNEMLEQIQQRDSAILAARDELEMRVEERTNELQTANRELEAFSYTVAHDLRGPLDAITGMSYILQSQYRDQLQGEGAEILDRLRGATHNMALLIDDLLHFSRATTAALQTRSVDLAALVRQVADDLQLTAPQRQVEFLIHQVSPVQADEGLMRVVIDNLLRNAWKYSSQRERARIEFGMEDLPDGPVYFVRDNGVGFDESRAAHLFEPFHRLHSKSEFPGTGIGLATVQRILARHNGRIWAHAEIGQGATFYFKVGHPG